jgi:hypothetical protein
VTAQGAAADFHCFLRDLSVANSSVVLRSVPVRPTPGPPATHVGVGDHVAARFGSLVARRYDPATASAGRTSSHPDSTRRQRRATQWPRLRSTARVMLTLGWCRPRKPCSNISLGRWTSRVIAATGSSSAWCHNSIGQGSGCPWRSVRRQRSGARVVQVLEPKGDAGTRSESARVRAPWSRAAGSRPAGRPSRRESSGRSPSGESRRSADHTG